MMTILSLYGISEDNLKYIARLIRNVTAHNIQDTKLQKQTFINKFPKSKQKKVAEFFDLLIKAAMNDIQSKSTFYYLYNLANKIDIKKLEAQKVPILGKIAAGQPILASEYIEGYLSIEPEIYGVNSTEDLFFLKVSGESMNLKVKNGDYALIRKQDYAENGDIIVAIVNGDNEATLKRYKKLNEQFVLLEPMSTDLSIEPITVDLKQDNFKIIGKAIGQFGKF